MNLYTYIIARDYGFAPNPFNNYCTLACCKSPIRAGAKVGDWVIGTGSVEHKLVGKLIYAMEVSEKLTFEQYWSDQRFFVRRAEMNGSSKKLCGDNIYHRSQAGNWIQEDSHHSKEDGSTNLTNLVKDTKKNAVLISTNFYYFGKDAVDIPVDLRKPFCHSTQGQKKIRDQATVQQFLDWLRANHQPGYWGDPFFFKKFRRYP